MTSKIIANTSEPSELIKTDSTEPNFATYRHLITAWILSYTLSEQFGNYIYRV